VPRLQGTALRAFSLVLPWGLRRRLLNRAFGFEIDPEARIGLSWTFPRKLVMGPGSRIGHLTMMRSLEEVRMGPYALIGDMNWITDNLAGFEGPVDAEHIGGRRPCLELGEFAVITARHYFDCSDAIEIGDRTSIGGLRSQFMAHSFDFDEMVQDCAPIRIGRNSFVGTGCLLLGGSALPDNALLAAGSVLVNEQTEQFALYAGSPATKKRQCDPEMGFFHRSDEWMLKSRSAYRRLDPKPRRRSPVRLRRPARRRAS
jgi:acetyltransferase-like isoleucine patch superfamily enzyme